VREVGALETNLESFPMHPELFDPVFIHLFPSTAASTRPRVVDAWCRCRCSIVAASLRARK
jgi:hypothetical protein